MRVSPKCKHLKATTYYENDRDMYYNYVQCGVEYAIS